MKKSPDDEWITTAMHDDSTVAELLLRLQKTPPTATLPTFRWGLRQPRSRSVIKCDLDSATKDGEPTRFSPTTPLSWSGGGGGATASPSNTDVYGFEASSRLMINCSSSARSKGIVVTNEAASSKKSNKKRTFSELKEEENVLMKERFYLNKEFATLHATLKEQTARNECLKRLQVEFSLHYPKKAMGVSVEPKYAAFNYAQQMQVSSFNQVPKLRKNETSQKTYCMLPDLNTTPSENDSCSGAFYGMN